jgi:hypothetical protein
MYPDTAIGTNEGLPWRRCTILQEAEALGDVLLRTVPLGHAHALKRLFCLVHASSATDGFGEA